MNKSFFYLNYMDKNKNFNINALRGEGCGVARTQLDHWPTLHCPDKKQPQEGCKSRSSRSSQRSYDRWTVYFFLPKKFKLYLPYMFKPSFIQLLLIQNFALSSNSLSHLVLSNQQMALRARPNPWTDDNEVALAMALIYHVADHNNAQKDFWLWIYDQFMSFFKIILVVPAIPNMHQVCSKCRDLKANVMKFNELYIVAHAEQPNTEAYFEAHSHYWNQVMNSDFNRIT